MMTNSQRGHVASVTIAWFIRPICLNVISANSASQR
jgi:hypothetical protein